MATEKSTPAITQHAPRREPYWESVITHDGLSLGFRRMPDTLAESWLARWIDRSAPSGRKEVSLRGQLPASFKSLDDAYAAATKAAIKLFTAARSGVKVTDMTVAQLCAAYTDAIEQGGKRLQLKLKIDGPRPETAAKMRAQQRRWISGSAIDPTDTRGYAADPIAKVKLKDLTETHCAEWRERMVAAAPHLKDSSINKELLCLRAPLNYGADILKLEPLQRRCWSTVLEKIDSVEAHAVRETYLTVDDRKMIADKATPELLQFMKFLLLTSVRPGAAAVLTVSSFRFNSTGDSVLTMGKDKTKKSTGRVLFIPLQTARFIKEVCGDRIGNVPLLCQADGTAWTVREWGRLFKKARNAAFPRGDARRAACIYTLRHCAITDLVEAGQTATEIAKWAGTSVQQIEDTYFKTRAREGQNGLARLVVNF